MVERLWVPLTQWLVARNWNWAMSGLALTASSVAINVAVSKPLRLGVSVVVMSLLSFVRWWFVWEQIAGIGGMAVPGVVGNRQAKARGTGRRTPRAGCRPTENRSVAGYAVDGCGISPSWVSSETWS